MPKIQLRRPDAVQWAQQHVRLPAGGPAPGALRLDPWQIECLRAATNPANAYAAIKAASQLGKTELLKEIVMYYMAARPSNVILALPRLDDVTRFHRDRLMPTLRNSPSLRNLLTRARRAAADEETGISNVRFPGGTLKYINAHAQASWRGLTAPALIADEIDVFPGTLDAQDPVQMLKQRGAAYPDGQITMTIASTPIANRFIDAYYDAGSRGVWTVTCVHCEREIQWTFKPEYADLGYIPCQECGAQFTDSEVLGMNMSGRFVHAEPDNPAKSFHINQFASLRKTHADTLREYVPASPLAFHSQILAESYITAAQTLRPESEDDIWADKCPFDTRKLSIGVDVQADRIEWTAVAWSLQRTRAHVHWHKIKHFETDTWRGKQIAWDEMYRDSRNWEVFIDTGYLPAEVKALIKWRSQWNWHGCYGGKSADTLTNPSGIIQGETDDGIVRMGTQHAKSWIAEMIRRKDLTINRAGVNGDYLDQLTKSEVLRISSDSKHEAWTKVKDGVRNEALDCLVYALGASLYGDYGYAKKIAKQRRKRA